MSNKRTINPNPPANFTPTLGDYKTLQPFRYWCQKVLPLVYDDSLSYYELLCKVIDYLNKTMEDVETLHSDTANLHEAYEQLQEYVNNYFSSLDVQEEINNKLDEMSQDGTLNNIVFPIIVRNENDFNAVGKSYTLANDIEITKPITAFKQRVTINLNGYTIKLSDNYSYNYVFTYDDSDETDSNDYKKLFNGTIDMNNANACVILQCRAWRTYLNDLYIKNCIKGLFNYIGTGTGAELELRNIKIIHSDNNNNDWGLDIQFGDSIIDNVIVIKFKQGIRISNGSNNYITNCHVWGYPKNTANQYSDNLIMNKGFEIQVASNTVLNCIADTIEPINILEPASYSNGGEYFTSISGNIRFINCMCVVHKDTNNSNHIGFKFYDTSPITSLPNYEYECKIINCNVTLDSDLSYFKITPLDDENNTTTVISCFNTENEFSFFPALEIGLNKWQRPSRDNTLSFTRGSNGKVLGQISEGTGQVVLPPDYDWRDGTEEALKAKLKLGAQVYPKVSMPIIGMLADGTFYFYDSVTDKFYKIQGTEA